MTVASIVRSAVAGLVVLAYTLMAFAGATHELSHFAARVRTQTAGNSGGLRSPSALTATHESGGNHLPDSGTDSPFCFFCVHCPSILSVVSGVPNASLQTFCDYFPTRAPYRHILPPTLAVPSLRGPPAIG